MSTSAPSPATRGTPEVILFDVGNTLLFPNWGRILAPLTAIGVTTTREQLQAIERKTKKQAWLPAKKTNPTDTSTVDYKRDNLYRPTIKEKKET